jgi:hypothetical protein
MADISDFRTITGFKKSMPGEILRIGTIAILKFKACSRDFGQILVLHSQPHYAGLAT